MSDTSVSTIVGATTVTTTEHKAFALGTKARTADGKLVQYVSVGASDIAVGAKVAVNSSGVATTAAAGSPYIGIAPIVMKAGQYGFIVLSENFGGNA